MHSFTELVSRCTNFTLTTLRETNEKTIEALQTSSETSLVKTLQMIRLQKTILAVGMFSIFEANLQDGLNCPNGYGFRKAKEILSNEGELDTKERFENLCLAINVLKHGHGQSYNTLLNKAEPLSFRIKRPNESFFLEGDVSEVSTLIEVDDEFVQHCANVINDVSKVIRRLHPELS